MALKTPFLAGILALLPEEERGKAETGLEEIEKNQLRQEDYSRLSDQATAEQKKAQKLYDDNVAWFEGKKADLAELDDLRKKVAGGGGPKGDDKTSPTAITREEFDKQMDATERGALGFIAESNALSLKHFQQFGEILDIRELLADKRIQTLGLQGVYQDKFATQLKAKADAATTAREEALRNEGAERVRKEMAGTHQQYPVRGNEPSTLDSLELAKDKVPVSKSVDDLASEYARLGTARAGA